MKTDNYKTLFDKVFRRKTILKIWGIILIIIFISINIISGVSVLNPKPKNISIVNFYNENIVIEINDSKHTLKPLEVFSKTIRTTKPIQILGKKESTKESIYNLTTDYLGLKSKLIVIALSENNEYCFFKENVTSFYYEPKDTPILGEQNPALFNLKDSLVLDTSETNAEYVFPGKSEFNDLSKELNKDYLIGVYPILCNELESSESQSKVIKAFTNYNREEQLKYLEEKVIKINQSGSLTELETIEY